MHQVHTLAQPACTGREHWAQAARTVPCRGAQWRRIVAQHRPCSRPPVAVSPRARARPCALPSLYRSTAARCIAIQPSNQAASDHDTIYCIATQSPSNQALACAPLALERGLAVSWPISWPYHTVSWAWPGRIVAFPYAPRTVMSRYNSIVS